MNDYLSIFKYAEIKIEIKRSIFIAAICPISTEVEALDFLNNRRKEHKTASHNVYAYRIASKNNSQIVQRYSDDGEPSGTSGLPIFNILNGRNIQDVIVVVTRYFGGTLLGTGGLVHAYTEAATKVIDEAGLATIRLYDQYKLGLSYSNYSLVEDRLNRADFEISSRDFTADVTLVVDVEKNKEVEFVELVEEQSKKQARIQKLGSIYKKIKIDE